MNRSTALRLQHIVFLLLFATAAGLLAWLSQRQAVVMDWSAGARNTLSADSRALLARLPGPVQITAFARPDQTLRLAIQQLVGRYQRHKPDLLLNFVNPDADPERVRALGIKLDGELHIVYQGRGEHVQQLHERGLTQALQRLSRSGQRRVLFLAGHGERRPQGKANHDFGDFGRELERTGVQLQELNLIRAPQIPEETAALVIAAPQDRLLPGEVRLVLDYLERGGHLLWLREPDADDGLTDLADALGVRPLPGRVVDADSRLFGVDNPAFVVVADYGPHPITANLRTLTLFPVAAALERLPRPGWQADVLLLTQARSWNETAPAADPPSFDPERNERVGPLVLGIALSRSRPAGSPRQRVVVVGDADFLSNTYLGNGANLELGLNLVNWLNQDERLLGIHIAGAPDRNLPLSDTALALIGVVFLLVLPLLLAGGGGWVWWRRRR